jgi:uncharacterized protein (DUF4213/DUF364 family)
VSIRTELISLAQRIAAGIELPGVRRLYIPEPHPHENRHTEFGVVELADGAAGLYYAWLGESQQGMRERYRPEDLTGSAALDLVALLERDNDADRSLGLAAVNALSQGLFRRAGYRPPAAPDSMAALAPAGGDHLGMVGYFPSLVERLRRQEVRVTVIEKKQRFQEYSDARIRVTPDPDALRGCNKVLITASTILNDSIDGILDQCRDAGSITVVGPTAGFLPEPLFERGVSAVGGTEVLDAAAVIEHLRADSGLVDCTRKYLIEKNSYPGIEALLDNLAD